MDRKIAAFDTETTDLPDNKLPIGHTKQPHIVQLATIITDSAGNELAEFNRLIRPEGYTEMAKGAFDAHGISFEKAMDEGLPRREVLDEWRHLVRDVDMFVAHNIWFDMKLLHINMLREYENIYQSYRRKKQFCTMKAWCPIIKMPPTEKMARYGFGPYKNPTLQEVYVHCFGEEFQGAHDGLSDARAVKSIYFKLPNATASSGSN